MKLNTTRRNLIGTVSSGLLGVGVFANNLQAQTGNTLYSAGNDGMNAVDPSDGSLMWAFTTDSNPTAVAAANDGQTVFIGDSNGLLQAIDATDSTQKWSAQVHSDRIQDIAVSPSDGTVYTASNDFTLRASDASDGSELWQFTDSTSMSAVGVSPDSPEVFCGGRSNFLRRHDPADGSVIWEYDQSAPVSEVSVGRGNGLVYCGLGRTREAIGKVKGIRKSDGMSDWTAGSNLYTVTGLTASPNGDDLFVGDRGGETRRYDEFGNIAANEQFRYAVNDFAPSPDGSQVIVGLGDGTDSIKARNPTDLSGIWQSNVQGGSVSGLALAPSVEFSTPTPTATPTDTDTPTDTATPTPTDGKGRPPATPPGKGKDSMVRFTGGPAIALGGMMGMLLWTASISKNRLAVGLWLLAMLALVGRWLWGIGLGLFWGGIILTTIVTVIGAVVVIKNG